MSVHERANAAGLTALTRQRFHGGEIEDVVYEDDEHRDEICEDCK